MNQSLKLLFVFALLVGQLCLNSGCRIADPIHTTFDLEATELGTQPDLHYASEKDVMFIKEGTITAPDGTVTVQRTEFRAEASPAARAQAERDALRYQADTARSNAFQTLATVLANARAPVPVLTVPPLPDTVTVPPADLAP